MVECVSIGQVVRFAIHPASWQSEQRTAAAGLYLAEPDILQHIPTDRAFDWEEHLLPLLVAQDQAVYGQLVDQPVVDIRTPAAYERVKDTGLA